MAKLIKQGYVGLEDEADGGRFDDARLGKRFRDLLGQLGERPGSSIPFACQDWANTKAAYRFLSNPRVTENQILAGHFEATRSRFERITSARGPRGNDDIAQVLVLHDTTELVYKRGDASSLGLLGRVADYTTCGVMMHSALVVTKQGLPLGLVASKFWTRRQFKGTNALARKINMTRIPIEQKESYRWLENVRESTQRLNDAPRCVHIGDRESDIFELFCEASALGTHFLIRTCVNRLAGGGEQTVYDEMQQVQCKGLHRVEIADSKGKVQSAELELKYQRIQVLPPIGKQKRYPALELTVLHARERLPPEGRAAVEWKLITDLPVNSPAQAAEKLRWYARRWKIEVFHKVLKSGCKVEDAKLRTAQRLTNLIAIQCILAWRIFWLTMINRAAPEQPATLVFTADEISVIDAMSQGKHAIHEDAQRKRSVGHRLTQLAKLGGYLGRTRDPPPGNMVIWRGMQRLTDITLGFNLKEKTVGN